MKKIFFSILLIFVAINGSYAAGSSSDSKITSNYEEVIPNADISFPSTVPDTIMFALTVWSPVNGYAKSLSFWENDFIVHSINTANG